MLLVLGASFGLARINRHQHDDLTGERASLDLAPSSSRRFKRATPAGQTSTTPKTKTVPSSSKKPTSKPASSKRPRYLNGLLITRTPEEIQEDLKRTIPWFLRPAKGRYDVRSVAAFLDSHAGHWLHDPRVYFTQQSPMDALEKLRVDVTQVPQELRFAYVMRTFNELGRKIASRMIMYNSQLIGVLKRKPDGLGSKPGLDAYQDAVRQAFTANEEPEKRNKKAKLEPLIPPISGRKISQSPVEPTITSLIGSDKSKQRLVNATLNSVSIEFAHAIVRFMKPAISGLKVDNDRMLDTLGGALKEGASGMFWTMNRNDKFRPAFDAVGHMNQILNKTMSVISRHVRDKDLDKFANDQGGASSHKDNRNRLKSQGLRDATGLVGPWNNYLLDNLRTTERLVRVFASLLGSIEENSAKTRFVNMYMPQLRYELIMTISSFQSLHASKFEATPSETKLTADPNASRNSSQIKRIGAGGYPETDMNRLPARCYLAGRRWRLLFSKAMRHYDKRGEVIQMFLDKFNAMKSATLKRPSVFNGDHLSLLCMPRIEVGLKGWGINGEPPGELNAAANKFPLRSPIEGLNKDEDPFTGGARMGYRLGFMVGYNEKRNQTLEMERSRTKGKPRQPGWMYGNSKNGKRLTEAAKRKRRNDEIDYLAKASYRKGLKVGARSALEVGCREGYMATLRVSLRAGMLLPLEAGTSLASLKGANYGSQMGGAAGRIFVNKYLTERDNLDEKARVQLMELGKAQGSLAGRRIGETVGAIAGHESALEAYRRAVTRGGKMVSSKFHLDEYLAGAMVGFDYGIEEGARVAHSSNVDPSAPKFFKLNKPQFSSKISAAFGSAPDDKAAKEKKSSTNKPKDNAGSSRGALIELPASLPTTSSSSKPTGDHWQQDLITPLTDKMIEDFHRARNHTRVTGTFKGTYNVTKEIKKGLQRVSLTNMTYNLEIKALGFAMNDVAYLSLSGVINNANVLHGSLIARNLIEDD